MNTKTAFALAALVLSSSALADAPKLSETKQFKLFVKDAQVLDFESPDKVNRLTENRFSRNGELAIQLNTKSEATLHGNAGSAPLLVSSGRGLLNFIEKTNSGNLHVLSVYDQYNEAEKGFFFIYRRSAMSTNSGAVSTFWGFARPSSDKTLTRVK